MPAYFFSTLGRQKPFLVLSCFPEPFFWAFGVRVHVLLRVRLQIFLTGCFYAGGTNGVSGSRFKEGEVASRTLPLFSFLTSF